MLLHMLFFTEAILLCAVRDAQCKTREEQECCITTNSENYNFYMFEIARIYKALKLFADLQGPICYNDPQNKEISLIVY